MAKQEGVAQGRHLRVDTSAVESNVHYPTDGTVSGDGIRMLSRSLKRIAAECKCGAFEVVHHGRALKYRLLEISRVAKSLTVSNRQRLQAKKVVIGDGAEWIWALAAEHFPDAMQIVDLYHARQHLGRWRDSCILMRTSNRKPG